MKRHYLHNIGKNALAASCLLASAAAWSAPTVKVSADIDSAAIVMGSLNHLRVTVDMPSSTPAQLIDFPLLTPGVEYLEFNGVDVVASDSTSTETDARTRLKFDFTIQAFDPGEVTIPPFAVLPALGADTAFSNVVTFKVLPVDVDSLATIHPMASVVSAQSRWYDYIPNWLIWLLAGLAVAAAAVWAYFTFHRHRVVVEERRKPVVPPYELAVQRLNDLQQRHLPENGHEKEYYTRLVDILRDYLQGRFGINAMEMTSTQIVKALRDNPQTRMTADEIRAVLSVADFVKFAKVRPLPDDNIRSFNRAISFVEQTRPKPEPEPEAENNDTKARPTKTK